MHKARGKILIDCLGVRIGEQRGAERFICRLVREIAALAPEEYVLLVNRNSAPFFAGLAGRERCVVAPLSGDKRVLRLLFQIAVAPVLSWLWRPRLYVSSAVFPAFGFFCPTAAFVYDLMLFHFPGTFSLWEWRFRRLLLDFSLPLFGSVFTISQASAADITGRYHTRSLGPVRVVSCGADTAIEQTMTGRCAGAVMSELGLEGGNFVLRVLGGKSYKNQAGLVRAAELLCQTGHADIQLAIAGDAFLILRDLQLPPNLKALGVVSDRVLAILYSEARALVFPSLFEGFGLPVIEAQAAGLPVVCSDIPVLREVSGGAAVFVDPHSPESIAGGIVEAIEDVSGREDLIRRGRENAERFTWRRSAETFLGACHPADAARGCSI